MIDSLEMIIASFNVEVCLEQALENLRKLENEQVIFLTNTAVMMKDMDGKITLRMSDDISTGKGALFGAIVGGLIGLLGGPAGLMIGAAAGAATGGIAAGKIGIGFPEEVVTALREKLSPGSSAILALVQLQYVEQVIAELDRLGATLMHQALEDELSTQLLADRNDV